MSDAEETINSKICEIILSIHLRHEFVSVERVKRDLFTYYQVESFRELNVDQRSLKALMNLIHYVKDVTFYMQTFEQVFNLCTLHDLGPLVAKFLKVNNYDDVHLGPIEQHPDVKRVFKYKPKAREQPVPTITSGQIINAYLAFEEKHRRRQFDYEEFLDELVKQNQLQKREELGVFCKSFPYLTQVTRKVAQDCTTYKKRVDSDAQKRIIATVEAHLKEIQDEVSNELEPSPYTNKSPMAVFDHLVSVVEKHLTVSQQKSVRDALVKIRGDELLRCLLNVSIYLGTLDKPERFIAEFQRLSQNQGDGSSKQNQISSAHNSQSNNSASNNNKQKRTQQRTPNMLNTSAGAPDTTIDTSFENSSTSYSTKPRISIKQLCSDLFQTLVRYETVLTVKQLIDIRKNLCNHYSVSDFADFGILDEDEHFPLDIISFLYKYREKIDPSGELSIYENVSSIGDRQELFLFVNQLAIINQWREKQQQDEYSSNREIPLSKDQITAVEKSIQHKFGGVTNNKRSLQIIKKAKTYYSKNTPAIIHFEESLLDEVSLNRLGICPPSLLVDEVQVCQLILQCPIMADLPTWLQWSHFFQARHGSLKTFIARKAQELDGLLLLETSSHELWRLPMDSSLENFEKELKKRNIHTSVGHLCSLIIREYVQVNRLPFVIYRQVMSTWFVDLRSSAELEQVEPMQYILEFLTCLPALIGQSRIVQELVLDPLDQVFGNDDENETINARQRIWMLAKGKERSKLEMWGYTLDIDEWKNENKWKGVNEPEEEPCIQPVYAEPLRTTVTTTPKQDIIVVSPQASPVVVPSTPPIAPQNISINTEIIIDENNPGYAAFEHIKKIREKLGVGSSIDEAEKAKTDHLQDMLGRALGRLSNDLYSEQNHFVLELIQNADDNQYSTDCLPTLRFSISSDAILVCNNEIGFQPHHVTAICDVGGSTKGKHKQGYTGHKGIGFKSVFMVSHRPEIHSGPYHFCFDTVNGTKQIGYICPIWMEKYDEILSSINEWITCIRLPLKEQERGDQLKRSFDDIHARLLLFLHRLRQIEIVRQKGKEIDTQTFARIDHAQGQIIELQKKSTTLNKLTRSLWLVIKDVIYVPDDVKKRLTDVKCEVEKTTIAIAYPLDAIQQASSYQTLPAQPLFAYLPLRSYSFRFILQADFEITADRQEVLRDNVWNEWLKKEMVKLLPKAYESFKNLPTLLASCSTDVQQHLQSLDPIQTLKYFIKMIPTRNNVDPYFNSFVDRSIQGLMGRIQLPVIRDENIEWISPSQCVIVRDAFIRQIFSSDLLRTHFNQYYLDEQFVKECDRSILIQLGCRQLDFSSILRLIRTLYAQNQQEHSTKTTTIEEIAQWIVCIDYSLQQERDQPGLNFDDHDHQEITTMDQLKQMKIFPLKNQTRLVSIEEFQQRAILFPLDKSTQYSKHLKIVLEDLPTLDERLLEYIEKKHPQRLESVKRLLKDLGISESRNVRRIYSNHILPIISDEIQWKTKSDSVLIAYLIFIYRELYSTQPEHFASDMEKLKTKLIVKTQQGQFVRINADGGEIVHLTLLYGCAMSLQLLNLPTHRFTFISDDYFNQYQKEFFYQDREKHRFVSFLNELNLHDFFLVKRVEKGFIQVEQLADTQWSHLIPSLSSKIFEPFVIQDYRCDELDALIASKDANDPHHYTQILLYLDLCYKPLAHYYAASVIRARERNAGTPIAVQGVESSFCLSLRNCSWIPVAGGQLLKPTEVYVLLMSNPFRRYLPCLDPAKTPSRNPQFLDLLGFKTEVLQMTMFELFIKWSCNLDRDSLYQLIKATDNSASIAIPCTLPPEWHQTCRDTIRNMVQIYTFLSTNNETCTLLARFRLWPLVFVPQTDDTGDFLFAHSVFWQDPESLIKSTQSIALQSFYGNDAFSKEFFKTILQVKQQPTLDDYLELLSNVGDKNLDYIWKCIKVITQLTFAQNKQELVRDKCIDWPFIPCFGTRNKLVKYNEQPSYPHDMAVAELFADTLPIIKLSDDLIKSNQFKQQFCSLFNIDDLGDIIKAVVDVGNSQPSTELLNFYSHSIDLIQHYLLVHGLLSETRSSQLQVVFSEMDFLAVDYIRLSYQYREHTRSNTSSSSTLDSYLDESIRKFYILQKYEKHENRHIGTMVKYLISDESARLKLSQHIQTLFKIYQDKGLEGLLKKQQELPEQKVAKWFIPQVNKQNPDSDSTEESEDKESLENDEPLEIPPELLEKMQNEPAWQLPKRNVNTTIDPNQPKLLTSFPARAGAVDSMEPSDKTHSSASQSAMIQNNENSSKTAVPSSVSRTGDVPQQVDDNKNTKPAIPNDSGRPVDGNIQQEKTRLTSSPQEELAERSTVPHRNPVTIADFTVAQPRTNFENIRISNFTDIALSPSALPNPPTNTNASTTFNETDLAIGRWGEEFVYRYLSWKYPNAQIQWMNQNQESGQPFDIQILHKDAGNRKDLIEVKTTRVHKQNTFQISIAELECLLANHKNYSIYRVYYANDEKSSTISILNQIKYHLQQKQLALSITIPE